MHTAGNHSVSKAKRTRHTQFRLHHDMCVTWLFTLNSFRRTTALGFTAGECYETKPASTQTFAWYGKHIEACDSRERNSVEDSTAASRFFM